MIGFVIACAAMIGMCLAIVLVPIWRRSRHADVDRRREANIEVYRQRCAEIDREVATARVSPAAAEAEKDELGARLLADVDAEPVAIAAPGGGARAKPWVASALVVVLLAAGGAGVYWRLGDWQAVENRDMPSVDQLVAGLEDDLKAHPDDRYARLMLAQAQQNAGQYAQAADNLEVLNRATDTPIPALLAAEAQARMAAGDALSGRAGQLYARLLRADPENREALWFLGLKASEAGDKQQAMAYWQRLLRQKLPDDVRAMVVSRRNALAGKTPKLRNAE